MAFMIGLKPKIRVGVKMFESRGLVEENDEWCQTSGGIVGWRRGVVGKSVRRKRQDELGQ